MENTQTGAGQSISAGCVTGRYYWSCGKPHGFADWRSPMNGLLKHLSALTMAAVFAGHCVAADRPAPPAVKPATPPLLAAHCLKCHGPDDTNGGFRVDTLPAAVDSIEAAERWQRVLNVLNSGEMPPDDAKQIESAAKADLLDDLAHDRASSGDAEFSEALADANNEKVLIFTDTTRAAMRAVLVKNGITRAANRLASTAMCEGWFVTMAEGRTRIGMIPIGAVQ